jgi:hypothetical protein
MGAVARFHRLLKKQKSARDPWEPRTDKDGELLPGEFERCYPGMVNVCLLHARGTEAWRDGGTDQCMCETVSHAVLRLQAEVKLAQRDEQRARTHRENLEAQLKALGAGE